MSDTLYTFAPETNGSAPRKKPEETDQSPRASRTFQAARRANRLASARARDWPILKVASAESSVRTRLVSCARWTEQSTSEHFLRSIARARVCTHIHTYRNNSVRTHIAESRFSSCCRASDRELSAWYRPGPARESSSRRNCSAATDRESLSISLSLLSTITERKCPIARSFPQNYGCDVRDRDRLREREQLCGRGTSRWHRDHSERLQSSEYAVSQSAVSPPPLLLLLFLKSDASS